MKKTRTVVHAPVHAREKGHQTMNQIHAQTPLTGPLRVRINRLAHTHAVLHEMRLKASWLEQVEAARDSGASFAEMAAMVAQLETDYLF
jgi:hypothetical protein